MADVAENKSSQMQDSDRIGLGARLGRALVGIAPGLAAAMGGPLAGAATERLAEAVLGHTATRPGATEALERSILAADPETIAAVRKAEWAFGAAVLEASQAARETAAADRADARARHIAMRDATPAVLGIAVIGGFFSVLIVMLVRELPPQAETEFSIMLGALATMTAAVVNFFFGSSADSREKTQIMAGRRPR